MAKEVMARSRHGQWRIGTGVKAKQEAGQKKLTEEKKVAFVNNKKKGEANRLKEKLREIAERRIEDMKKKIRD